MKYLCLIFDEEKTLATMPKTQLDALMDDYRHFSESIRKSGHYVNGSQLAPTRAASTVRVRKDVGHRRPFAETKEQLSGYYLIEAADLNEALQIASRIPSARMGSIEVRPLIDGRPDAAG
jgi:hypothetical protein